ncbi:hypothetical protein I7I53_06659 [Histoplasma capsulatum var. duboisii H88]|uniref:Uncharacterized protein n=1 Tax=Ajellomyces capsulatus (strain H88) TaxID=544711 RepID=A0A8A1LFY1_AJEC8|nr:hypothetical protein I7I53_06659 [Histoplasma capsulatum var. duboisii H88]
MEQFGNMCSDTFPLRVTIFLLLAVTKISRSHCFAPKFILLEEFSLFIDIRSSQLPAQLH